MAEQANQKHTLTDLLQGKVPLYDPTGDVAQQMAQGDRNALWRHPQAQSFIRPSPEGECAFFDALREELSDKLEYSMVVSRGESGAGYELNPVAQIGEWRIGLFLAPEASQDMPTHEELDAASTNELYDAWLEAIGNTSMH